VAKADVATYDLDSCKIVLAGKPRVMRGKDVLEGEVITMFRNESRILVYPRARLVVYPEKGGAHDQFFGPGK
jgi:lipopolysaccharide export system protein LptA